MNTDNIISSINAVAQKIFKAVEGEVYPLLDKIVNINPKIFSDNNFLKTILDSENNIMFILLNSFVLFFLTYYVLTQLVAIYNGKKAENVYVIILKTTVCYIIAMNSYEICKYIVMLVSYLTEIVENYGKTICGNEVSFDSLKEIINNLKNGKDDLISINGMINALISFGAVTVVLNLSIRYVTIMLLTFISPIAFISISSDLTAGFFKSFIKTYITLLLNQIIIKIILIIPLSFKSTEDIIFKIVLVGSIYLIYKIDSFTKDLLKNISTNSDMKSAIAGVKGVLNNDR